MKPLLTYTLFCVISLLNGCTTLTLPKQQEANRPLAHAFQISGAIAAKNQQHGWIANFTWSQRSRHDYQIILHGPLGSDTIDITMQHGMLTYHEGNKVIHSKDPEALLAQETGIRIPLNNLYDWIRGQPAPGTVLAITRDSEQNIILLKQAGFVIRYEQYDHHYPHKIRLEAQGLMIKIVMNHRESA